MADYLSYLKNNPDVATWAQSSGKDPKQAAIEHYYNFGLGENRQWGDPSITNYLSSNPDVTQWAKTEGLDPFTAATRHYSDWGATEGRAWGAPAVESAPVDTTASPIFNLPTLTPNLKSTSGINWKSPAVAGMLDMIKSWTGTSSDLAKNAIPNITNFYNNLMNRSLGPEAFQGTLNDLRKRNMLGSPDIVGEALSRRAGDISSEVGNKAYDTFLKAYDTQMQMPGYLSDIAKTLGGTQSVDPYKAYELVFGNYI